MQTNDAPVSASGRLIYVDALRGLALIAMAVYHLSWDLSWFRIVDWNVSDGPKWSQFAQGIAGSFLFLVGFSLVLAHGEKFRLNAFLKREAMIIAAATLVSVGTYFAFEEQFVRFGILHNIAVSSVIALPFVFAPIIVSLIGALALLLAPALLAVPFLKQPAFFWLGLEELPALSVDYVPIIPWTATVLIGIVFAKSLKKEDALHVLNGPGGQMWFMRGLRFIGRHSLIFYLVHQPILIGLVWASVQIGIVPNPDERVFLANCEQVCNQTINVNQCTSVCGCTLQEMQQSDDWSAFVDDPYSALSQDNVKRAYATCELKEGK